MSENYTLEFLRDEYEAREPVRSALDALRVEQNINGLEVVELGSGLGFNLDVFVSHNAVLGVEGLASAVSMACTRGIQTVAADLEKSLPLETSSCDLVLCLDVLEHLVKPDQCLREAHRILRPDGKLVINVPNQFTLTARVNLLLGSGIDATNFFPNCPEWQYPHVRFFRRPSIGLLLERCGFAVTDDWSWKFPSIPVLDNLKPAVKTALFYWLARKFPNLFAGGFFLIAKKS